jgi:CheY-like chemotaxis protein
LKKPSTRRSAPDSPQRAESEKLEAVARLAGGIAHDFNNLLTAIIGYGELLGTTIQPESQPWLDEILKASDRATALTRQLLALGRRQIARPRTLDLGKLVDDLLPKLRASAGPSIRIEHERAAGPLTVTADPDHLAQAISQLVANGGESMASGGVVKIRTHGTASRAVATVTDAGAGMSEETRSHLFEAFFTTKKGHKGLGLAVAYALISQSGGRIEASVDGGPGSIFIISLPRAVSTTPSLTMSTRVVARRGPATILLAEDEAPLRALCAAVLRDAGHTVLDAASGGEAIDAAAAHDGEIHLLVTDVIMPGITGPELARRLEAERPGLKVLFVSGYTADELVKNGVLDRKTALMEKPFRPSDLVDRVRGLIGTRKA